MQKDLDPSKKNQWSIPRTTSCLSNIQKVKHLDVATDLISRYKRTGNVFINLTGNTGLSLYSSMPMKVRQRFFDAFKRNPRAFIGFTKSHLVIHIIKVLDKHRLLGIFTPLIALSLILSILPINLVWVIFIGSAGYLVFSVIRKFKHKPKAKKGD
jgi:hypothetical protein